MVGITAYGVYVPLHRLGPDTKGWYGRGERSVAGFDEDPITMAVTAAMNCLDGKKRTLVDGLYFASTTSPYLQKQAAATVATALDLPRNILTLDSTNSLRAGTIALRHAVDTIKAGSARQILVVAADMRVPQPHSELEQTFGDGSIALLIGDTDVSVSIEDSYSISDEILDEWHMSGEKFIRTWENRFVNEEGYLSVLKEAVSGLMTSSGLNITDFARAAFYAPDAKRHRNMANALGLNLKTQVQDGMFGIMGNTGTAFALMTLSAALEEAKVGDKILLANYGDGADALYLQATEQINQIKCTRTLNKYLQSKRILDDYVNTYAHWRGLINIAPAARRPQLEEISSSAAWRERDKNIRFLGVKCKNCGYPQHPPQRICTRCQTRDQFEPYRFSDKKASIFTYASDYLSNSPDPPLVSAIVNFEGGGRIMIPVVDRDISQLQLGMPVEMTFRRLYTVEGINNYNWCCTPVRIN